MESEPWYSVLDDMLPLRSKNMTRQQGVVYLKRVVIKPFIENLDWFFALYKDYRVISDVNPSRLVTGKYIPAATVKIYRDNVMVFEYKITIILEPEDNDSTIVRTTAKVSKEYMATMLVDNCCYRRWYEECDGFIHQYHRLWNGELLTTTMLLDDFAKQYSFALRWAVKIH